MRVSLLSTFVTTLLFTGALACPTKHEGKHGGKHGGHNGGKDAGKDVGQGGGKQVLPLPWGSGGSDGGKLVPTPSWTPSPELAGKKSLAYYGNWVSRLLLYSYDQWLNRDV
jgi:hypothetical protein